MVSYYNSLSYSQRHSANLPYPPTQHWFPSNYHPSSNHQFLNDVDSTHHQHMYYNPHMLHQASADWHSAATAHDHYSTTTGQTQLIQQHQQQQQHDSTTTTVNQLNDSGSAGENLTEGLPSPPITVSGSEISSPGAPNASSSPSGIGLNGGNIHNRPAPAKSPYYDWMKKPSYPTQPTPGSIEICSAPSLQDFTAMEPCGKTRTKDKYRVVYTDYQRLELEKEYHTSKYITIRRKTELAQTLQLSERQVKIWFQNRRAKERKQNKKRDDPLSGVQVNHHHHHHSNSDLANLIDSKPKIESGLHLQHHPLHQMSSMAMGMSPMSLHHSVLHHGHHLGVPHPPPPPPPPPPTSTTASSQHHHPHHHLHQSHQQVTAVAATVGALAM